MVGAPLRRRTACPLPANTKSGRCPLRLTPFFTINCLLINPGWLGAVRDKIGGDWAATGESCAQESKFSIAWLDRLFPQ